MAIFVLAALLNRFGQGSTTTSESGAAATLSVRAPERLRGGLIFQGRFEIHAARRLGQPRVLLANGWIENMTLNATEPQPVAEHARGPDLELDFNAIPAGDRFTLWTEWQVNPTNVGSRSQDVALYDGDSLVARVDRSVTVFP